MLIWRNRSGAGWLQHRGARSAGRLRVNDLELDSACAGRSSAVAALSLQHGRIFCKNQMIRDRKIDLLGQKRSYHHITDISLVICQLCCSTLWHYWPPVSSAVSVRRPACSHSARCPHYPLLAFKHFLGHPARERRTAAQVTSLWSAALRATPDIAFHYQDVTR